MYTYAKSPLRALLATRRGRQQVDALVTDKDPGFARRYAWAAYLTGMTGLALLYLFAKDTPFHSGPAFNVLGLSSVVAVVAATWMHRAPRLPWALIACGLATFVSGDVLAYNYQRFFGHELPFPSVADGFYLAMYPLLIAGMVMLIRRRNPAHDRAALIDALIVSTSAGALSWTLLIAPYAHDHTLSLSTKLTAVAYPFVDLAIAVCVARLAFGRGRRSPALAFLIVGVLSLLATDSIYGWKLLHGGYTTGGLLDGGWIAFYLLIGAAALHPSSLALVEPAPDRHFGLTPGRIVGLASCALVTPTVMIVEGIRSGPRDVALLAAGSGAIFLLVFVRLLDLGRRHRAGLHRATVLAEAGSDLIEARTVDEVEEVASRAGDAMLGRAGEVTIIDTPERAPMLGSSLTLPLQGRRESHGLLVARRTGATVDPDTHAALCTLANVVALALDGIERADELTRQRAEEAKQVLGEAEEQLRQSQKMDAVGSLAGGIAHDFNNLLTAINGYASLLLGEPGSARMHEFAGAIGDAGERAAALTQQLLAFSRKQVLRPDVMNLNGVVLDMTLLLERLIGEEVTIELELDPDLQCTEADRSKLDQVLLNLVVNARDAMAGSGTVTISTRNESDLVVLEVADTGIGMEQATAERIFEPFFTTKDVGTGTGLGLSTVYGIITQTGGTIQVHSEPGEGATFTVRLPATLEELRPIPAALEPAAGGRERVLIVDDERAICEVLAAALRAEGYAVTTATSAAEARSLEGPWDALLTDVVMPDTDGVTLAHQIDAPHTLFMSGYDADGLTAKEAHFLQKPFELAELSRAIRQLLDEPTATNDTDPEPLAAGVP
jgi:signal transduction histidine kinase